MKPQLKSKTNWLGVIVLIMGFLQSNIEMVRERLGDWYGLVFILIGISVIVLRQVTTGPVGGLKNVDQD